MSAALPHTKKRQARWVRISAVRDVSPSYVPPRSPTVAHPLAAAESPQPSPSAAELIRGHPRPGGQRRLAWSDDSGERSAQVSSASERMQPGDGDGGDSGDDSGVVPFRLRDWQAPKRNGWTDSAGESASGSGRSTSTSGEHHSPAAGLTLGRDTAGPRHGAAAIVRQDRPQHWAQLSHTELTIGQPRGTAAAAGRAPAPRAAARVPVCESVLEESGPPALEERRLEERRVSQEDTPQPPAAPASFGGFFVQRATQMSFLEAAVSAGSASAHQVLAKSQRAESLAAAASVSSFNDNDRDAAAARSARLHVMAGTALVFAALSLRGYVEAVRSPATATPAGSTIGSKMIQTF